MLGTHAWVGRCGPGVQTLTLFKTQFSDFHIPFEPEFKIFRPYLRHLTQNHTSFRTRMKLECTSFLLYFKHWQSQSTYDIMESLFKPLGNVAIPSLRQKVMK